MAVPNNLKLVTWNARSIARKSTEFAVFLQENEIDVALVSETHLKPNTKLWIPTHRPVRMDRPTASGGGVAILVKNGISFRTLPSFQTTSIESVGVEIDTSEGSIAIIAVYCPKQSRKNDGSAREFKNDIIKLTRRYPKFIIAGDLNARHETWGNVRRNNNGVILNDDLLGGGYTILSPETPTFVKARSSSIIDIYITNVMNIEPPITIEDLSSDHYPVVTQFGADIERRPQTRRNFHRVDWNRFRRIVDSNVDPDLPLETSEDIDTAVENIEEAIRKAEAIIPIITVKCKLIVLDIRTKLLIRLRNVVRRQYQRTGNPTKRILKNRLTVLIRDRVDKIKNENFAKDVEKLEPSSRPFWKLTKILKNKPKPIPPLLPLSGVSDRLMTPSEKASAIGNHFLASHCLGQGMTSRHEEEVEECIRDINNTPFPLPEEALVSTEELRFAIRNTKNMKAPGFDGVFNLELKNMSDSFFSHLANILNNCLRIGYFPWTWKRAKVIPIIKPGKDPTSPSSYRPISLLSSLSKLFEKIIQNRLLNFANENNIFPEEQFGFRRGMSTVHQLSRVYQTIKRNREVAKTTAMALLDIEKAFDNVWHHGLLFKLKRFNVPLYIIKILQSYLTGRSFQVFISGTLSEVFMILAGVPQGSILGPILFNLFTSDLPALPGDGTLSLFADDTALMFKGRVIRALTAKLQTGLNMLAEYFVNWKIKINATKTQTIIFPHSQSRRLIPADDIKIQLGGNLIEWSKEVVYLGLTLDSKLIFKAHVDKIKQKCTTLLKSLYPLINRKSKLNMKNKLAIYKAIVYPVIEYAAPIWTNCAKTHKQKAQIIQNKYLRLILNESYRTRISALHGRANIEMIEEKLNKYNEKHKIKSRNNANEIIRNIYMI